MAHPLLEQACTHTQQARAINDEYEGKAMPAEAARQMEEHLNKASELRRRVDAEARLQDTEQWISEPQYKHDMSNGASIAQSFGHGDYKMELEKDRKQREQKAFLSYIRKGERDLPTELKAALVEDATGQNLVPTDFAGTIIQQLPRNGVMRNLAYVRPTTSNVVDVGNVVINTAGWGKLETGTTATDGLPTTPAAKSTITVWDLNALVLLGRDELADSDANLETIIRDALAMKFAEVEDDAYAAGTGTAQPWAISHGVTQAITAATNATVTGDDLKKLIYKVPAQFRNQRSAFVGHTSAEQGIALLKDTTGNYLMQPSAVAGEPGRVFGYRWFTMDGLADMAATGTPTDVSVMYGDFYSGYMICDRQSLTVQRLTERYAEVGKVGLLFTMRVGGDVIRPQALAKYLL